MLPIQAFITDAAGNPINGAKIYTYAAGTLSPKAVYTTAALTVAHPNPIIAANGKATYFLGSGSYRIRVTDAADVDLPQYAVDEISAEAVNRTVYIDDFAADGTTDYAAAINAAIAELGGAGTVRGAAKVYTYGSEIQIPPYVNIVGEGKGATIFRSTAANARFYFINGTADGRGGESGGFELDGNDIGTDLLKLDYAVERAFRDVLVQKSFTNGGVLNGTQNTSWYNCDFQNCRAAPLVFDLGAGNNRFFGGEFNKGGTYNIIFRATGIPPVVGDSGAFPEPTGNSFFGCVIERLGWNGADADPDTGSGLVYHGAGKFNHFQNCSFALPFLDSTTKPLILMEKAGTQNSLLLSFGDCYYGGTAARTTAIEVRANCSVVLSGRQNFETHQTALAVADTGSVGGDWDPTLGAVTAYFANQGGGTQPQQNLLYSNKRLRQAFLTPLNFVAQSMQVPGESFARSEVYPGLTRYGGGAAAANISTGFTNLYGIDGLEVSNTLAPTSFVFRCGPIDIVIGNTVPTVAAPNGSIGINTAGASGTTLYVRAAGAWVAK